MRPPIPEECPERWSRLMQECWVGKATDRPDFQHIITELAIIQDLNRDDSDITIEYLGTRSTE